MCGIAGIFRRNQNASSADVSAVQNMLALQAHRGPDGEGVRSAGPVVLGHRRLSIIDPGPTGAQPMTNESGSVWVTFNGEIYNFQDLQHELVRAGHRFRSNCDTEVLVHGYEQWGLEGLLRRLRGMFAFALYDSALENSDPQSEFLFLARDQMGIKPLYYGSTPRSEAIAFASEAKALVRAGLVSHEIDQVALTAFLSIGSVPFPVTWYKNVRCLPPGHYMALNGHRERVQRYWDIGGQVYPVQDLGSLLEDCVRRHLIADVPIGIFLSGGVDSSAVAALAAQVHSGSVKTLTIAFAEASYNEAAEARLFAHQINSQHHEVRVGASDFAREMPNILSAMDQPTADGVNTYFVSRAARELGLKVVLSGLGGDEVFGGYGHYRRLVSRSGVLGWYANAPASLRNTVSGAATAFSRLAGGDRWGRFGYARGLRASEGFYLLVRGFFPPHDVRALSGASQQMLDGALDAAFAPLRSGCENGHIDSRHFQYMEMRRYMHDQLLRDSDVFSMAHSIELRVPLVDQAVVEAGWSIPESEKISPRMNKPKLVAAVRSRSLADAAARPKRGFTFPFAEWLRAQAGELEAYALEADVLDRSAVRDCWRKFRSGRVHWSRAWSTVAVRAVAGDGLTAWRSH